MKETRNQQFAACARFDEELPSYLEGEARPFVGSHVQECASCKALLAELNAVRQAAQALPLETPSRAVWEGVRARLEADGAFLLPACLQFDDDLEAYIEGEERPFIPRHAQECRHCAALLADLQALPQAVRDLPEAEPSPALWAKVRAGLEAEGVLVPSVCHQFNEELSAFIEGEARPFVAAHAQDCTSCGALLADLEAIRQAARELPQEEPSRVVWANVRARLDADGAFTVGWSGWRHFFGWRAVPHAVPVGVLAALVFLGSALTMPSSNTQRWIDGNELASSETAGYVASAFLPGEDGSLARVVSDLEKSFRANEASMAPDLKAAYEKSLVSLDASIRECLDSLQHEPRNTLANDYLLAAYTRKAEVLSSALEFEGR